MAQRDRRIEPAPSEQTVLEALRSFTRGTRGRILLSVLAVAVILLVAVIPAVRRLERAGLIEFSELGALAPLWFIFVYCILPLFLLPVMPLDFAAGAHFGFWEGVAWVQVAAMASALIGWLAGRTVLRGLVHRLQKRRPRLGRLDDAVAKEGMKILLLCRLSSFFPFSLLNLAFGGMGVSLGRYLLATFLGTLPGTLMTVYAGDLAGDLSGAPGHESHGPGEWIMAGLGLAATIGVVVFVTRKAQVVLQRALEADPTGGPEPDVRGDAT